MLTAAAQQTLGISADVLARGRGSARSLTMRASLFADFGPASPRQPSEPKHCCGALESFRRAWLRTFKAYFESRTLSHPDHPDIARTSPTNSTNETRRRSQQGTIVDRPGCAPLHRLGADVAHHGRAEAIR